MANQDETFLDPSETVQNPPGGPVPNNTGVSGPPVPPPAANPFNPQMRDRIVRGWANSGSAYANTRQGIEQYLQSLGGDAQGWRVDRDDKVYDPSGRVYDWIGNVNTANAQKRTGYTTDSRYADVTGSSKSKKGSGAKGGSAAGGAGGGGGAAGGAGNYVAQDPRWSALYEQLMARSKQGLDVENNPVINAQADTFAANQQRQSRDYLGNLAESAGPMANLRGEQRMTAERTGQATGAFKAELMGREVQAKRDEIAQALNSMQGMLTEEQRLGLQKELAVMDDTLKRFSLAQQNRQFGVSSGMEQQRINSGNDQFYADLGLRAEDRSRYWDSVNRGLF